QSVHLARKLRTISARQARKTYLDKKRQSFRHSRQMMKSLVDQTRVKLAKLRRNREVALKRNEVDYKKRYIQQKRQYEKDLRAIEDAFTLEQFQSKERYVTESTEVQGVHQRRREDDHDWQTQSWTALLRDWKSACDHFVQICRDVAREAEQWFPDWS